MTDTTARVQQWRQRLKNEGKVPLTIYIGHTEKLRLEDLAATWHCSVSELVQQALAVFRPGSPPAALGSANDTADSRELIRDMIREELRPFLEKPTPEASVTETLLHVPVTDTPQQARQPTFEQVSSADSALVTLPERYGSRQPDHEQVSPASVPLAAAALDTMPLDPVAIAPQSAPPALDYDPQTDELGPLCEHGHNYQGTGQSLRRKSDNECRQCRRDRNKAYKARKRQPALGFNT